MAGLRLLACALAVMALPCCTSGDWPCSPCARPNGTSTCCCMHCAAEGTDGPHFACLAVKECLAVGGQCKHRKTSAYLRPQRAQPAPRAAGAIRGGGAPEQAHILADYPDAVTIVYVTDVQHNSSVEVRRADNLDKVATHFGNSCVYSTMYMALAGNGWADGWEHAYDDDAFPAPPAKLHGCGPADQGYKNPDCMYTSGHVHTVRVSGLQPGVSYEYRLHGSEAWTPFRALPAVGRPISLGVLADLGQTADSVSTMRHLADKLAAGGVDGALFAGDLSYADGYADAWDSYGRLGEFLWGRMPTAHVAGNHEWEGEQFTHFLARYAAPSQRRSGSDSPLWYSFEAGLAHVVGLCSYCVSSKGSAQYAWLEQDLASVNRSLTPWLVVMMHVPWYTSNAHHSMEEGRHMREAMEKLIHEHKADVVFAGHMHAYERTKGVYQNRTACDAPVHIVIGDGGNHEGPSCPWYQKELPEWDAFREFSFGHGVLRLTNATHARWSWHRNHDRASVDADEAWLARASMRCGNSVLSQMQEEGVFV